MKLLEKSYPVKRISPAGGDYFFGYYDLQPFCGNLHLTHKVKFTDRLHKRGDSAEVGLIDINTAKYEALDVTGAWNFQQGAMLQWNPRKPTEEIIYNSLSDGDYQATVLNIHSGKKRFLDRPVANVSPKGDYALSINFDRLYDFRPGYGYAQYGDSFYYEKHSKNDGVFLTDLETGKSRLIISMEQIWEFSRAFWGSTDLKLVINHITFNTDGSRFLFLVRNFPEPGKRHDTAIITANTDGSGLYLLSDYGVQSHYHWRDPENVIFYADGKELACGRGWANNYLLRDRTHEGEMIADGFFDQDNHMSYSPDRKLLLTDTYPNDKRMQKIRIYSFEHNSCVELGSFYSLPRDIIDIRCDLHPRWNQDGTAISFDSTHEGFRGIYMIDTASIANEFLEEKL